MAQRGRPPKAPKRWQYGSVWATQIAQFDRSINAMALDGWEPMPGCFYIQPAYFYCLMRREHVTQAAAA